jgi:hypothetical protein
MSAWIIAGGLIALMAIGVKAPTLKHAHVAIVTARAAWLMAREMWDGAMTRRERWSECLERAGRDF